MIRRGLALLLMALVLTGCSIFEPPVQPRIGTLQLDIQNRPQQEEDVIADEAFKGDGISYDAESTRHLGSDDGRDFYVASSTTNICLIELSEAEGSGGAVCNPSLPLKMGDDSYQAELWWDKVARQGSPVGFWIGDYLWMQS